MDEHSSQLGSQTGWIWYRTMEMWNTINRLGWLRLRIGQLLMTLLGLAGGVIGWAAESLADLVCCLMGA